MQLIRKFDFFTKAKEEIDTSSGIGGLFSIIGFIFGILFFIIEISSYFSTSWTREMSVDHEYLTRRERVNIDVIFHKAPCLLISLTQQEEEGVPIIDIPLNKQRYDAQGNLIGDYNVNENPDQEAEYQDLVKAIENKEYCRIYGNFSVLEIPGDFHFSYRTKLHLYRRLPEGLLNQISLDLTVNHLTFGMDVNHKVIYNRYGKSINFSSYDGISFRNVEPHEKINFFVKIVPNYFLMTERAAKGVLAYQYSLNYQKKEAIPPEQFLMGVRWQNFEMPTFRVNYEFSPITINYRYVHNSSARFLVDTLAIIGGIFSVMGMLNSFALSKFKYLRSH